MPLFGRSANCARPCNPPQKPYRVHPSVLARESSSHLCRTCSRAGRRGTCGCGGACSSTARSGLGKDGKVRSQRWSSTLSKGNKASFVGGPGSTQGPTSATLIKVTRRAVTLLSEAVGRRHHRPRWIPGASLRAGPGARRWPDEIPPASMVASRRAVPEAAPVRRSKDIVAAKMSRPTKRPLLRRGLGSRFPMPTRGGIIDHHRRGSSCRCRCRATSPNQAGRRHEGRGRRHRRRRRRRQVRRRSRRQSKPRPDDGRRKAQGKLKISSRAECFGSRPQAPVPTRTRALHRNGTRIRQNERTERGVKGRERECC